MNREPTHTPIRTSGIKDFYNSIYSQYYDPASHMVSCRVREIHEGILRDLRASVDGIILDVGCGCQKAEPGIFGCDLSIEALRMRNLSFPGSRGICGDIRALPFKKKSFAAILAGLLLDHLKDPRTAFCSLKSISMPEARLELTVFDSGSLPSSRYMNNTLSYHSTDGRQHLVSSYGWNAADLKEMASMVGWLPSPDIKIHSTTDTDYSLMQIGFTLSR